MTSNVQLLAPRRLLRRSEVQDRVGLCKSTLYSRISVGTFPKPVTLGSSVRWVESEVEAWISERVSERDHGNETGGYGWGYRPSLRRATPCRVRLGRASKVEPTSTICKQFSCILLILLGFGRARYRKTIFPKGSFEVSPLAQALSSTPT